MQPVSIKHYRCTRQQGFTLIELLIASSLLAVILLLGTYSYSLFANNWQKRLGHYHTTVAEVKQLETLRRLLAGVAPVGVAGEDKRTQLYFSGAATQLQAFSRYGIQTDQQVWFALLWNRDSGELWYREAPVSEELVNAAGSQPSATKDLVLLTGVTDLRFEYYGWNSVSDKNATLGGFSREWPEWRTSYDGSTQGLMPTKLRLSLVLQQGNAPVTIYANLPSHAEVLLQQGAVI